MQIINKKKRFIFIIIGLLLLSVGGILIGAFGGGINGPSSAPNLDEYGLVGYWNFEEGTGQTVYDRSGNGNNGTLGASTAVAKDDPVFTSGYSSSGPGGTALQFDGVNDYVKVLNSASLALGSAITVEAWVKPTVDMSVGSTNQNRIADKMNWPNSGWYLLYSSSGDQFLFYTLDGTTHVAYYSVILSINTWYHIVGVSDGTTNRLYLNGKAVGTPAASGTLTNSNADLYISGSSAAYTWNGSIDEVRIYNRALSADEIRQHYNQKKPILEMKFDEGSGTSIKDESFNNNDGTLNLGSGGNTTVANAWVQGKYGSAISFDGTDDYVNAGNASILNPVKVTIEAWINPGPTQSDYSGIVGETNAAQGYALLREPSINKWSGIVKVGGASYWVSDNITINNVSNRWVHYVVTYDGEILLIYRDGILVGQNSIPSGNLDPMTTNSKVIGRHNTYYFNGLIDDVRIYNYARTQDEILTDYNAGKAAHLGKDNQRDDGLVGYWNMEEGTGQTISDRSGNGNNGTLGANSSVGKDDPVFTSGYSSSGPGGTALQFDGSDDYVGVPNSTSLNITNAITIEAWVYRIGNSSGYPKIVEKQRFVSATDNGGYTLGLVATTRQVHFYIRNNNDIGAWTSIDSDNVWYHIVATYDGFYERVYINGVLKVSVANSAGIGEYSSANFKMGGKFNGSIDEVRIYNRALSADEIRQHYNQKKPILEMKFDEGSGTSTKDESFNNNDGTLNLGSGGNTTVANAWVQGKYGSAISFDGTDDYVSVGNILPESQIYTLGAWIKTTATAPDTDAGMRVITIQRAAVSTKIALGMRTSKVFSFMNGTPGGSLIGTSNINDGKWHYIGVVYDGTVRKLFVDGVQEKLQTTTFISDTTTDADTIGCGPGTAQGFFSGLIDDVRIYNYARTQDEILTDYNAGKAAHLGKDNQRDDGLVGYWNMEEGTGQTVYDRSGNGNNGTLGANSSVGKDDPVFTSGYSSAGPGGTGLQFDGVDDYVNAGNAASLNSGLNQSFTLETWIYPTNITNQWTRYLADARYSSNLNGYELRMDVNAWPNPTSFYFQVGVYRGVAQGDTDWGAYAGESWGTHPLSDLNKWYHLVATWNKPNLKFYRNGVLVGSATYNYDIYWRTDIETIIGAGQWNGKGQHPFNGTIDEVRIYNRVLSADEIRQHYNQKKPILEMKFDEGSGTSTKDESFNNNDGTLSLGSGGNTTVANAWVSGKYGSALSFDGTDDYVDAGNGASLNFTNAITISVWAKTPIVSDGTYDTIISKFSASPFNGWFLRRNDNSDRVNFTLYNNGTYTAYLISPVIVANEWTHYVGTFDGTIAKFYINGTLVETDTDASMGLATSAVVIGANYGGSGEPWNGLIDDVRIYNYARTAEEIKVDYNNGLAAHLR